MRNKMNIIRVESMVMLTRFVSFEGGPQPPG